MEGWLINSLVENSVEGTRLDRRLDRFVVVAAEDVRGDSQAVDEILSYFEGKTRGERLPCRADISPGDLKRFLPDFFIFQVVYDDHGELDDLLVQLMGTTVANFYGEITGRTVRDGAPSPEVAERILVACRRVAVSGVPQVGEASSLSEEKNHLRVRVLYVPLSEDGKRIDRICGHAQVMSRSATE